MQNPATVQECEQYIMQRLAPAGFTLDPKGWTGTPLNHVCVLQHAHSGFVYNLLVTPGQAEAALLFVELKTENYRPLYFSRWGPQGMKPLDELCADLTRLNTIPEYMWANLRMACREQLEAETEEKDAAENVARWQHILRQVQKKQYAASETARQIEAEIVKARLDYSGS